MLSWPGNRLYLEEHYLHPEWQTFGGSCITVGLCPDDSQVTSASCNDMSNGDGRYELLFP